MTGASTEASALTGVAATELLARLATGEVSSTELVEAHIERQQEPSVSSLNAVVVTRYGEARAEAAEVDRRRAAGEALGPLAGLPVTVKECLDLAGTPSTFGIEARRDHRATSDETHVARWREAGAVVLAKTNVPQFLAYVEADNPVYGRTDNPWDRERTCGGSTGGEAALIAAGGSALGLGTDIGGSCRVPPSFCGIVGLKPTQGRTTDTGRGSFSVGQQAIPSQVGVLGATVADVSLGLEVANGGRSPDVLPGRPLGDPSTVELASLRVAVFADDGLFAPAPAVRRSVAEAAAALADAGAEVVEWQPLDLVRAMGIGYHLLGADGIGSMVAMAKGGKLDFRIKQLRRLGSLPGPVLRSVGKLLGAVGQQSLSAGTELLDTSGKVADYWDDVIALDEYRAAFAAALDGVGADLVLCPGTALPAIRHGASNDLGLMGSYTFLFNVLGWPAGVVPWSTVGVDEQVGRAPSKDRVEKTARVSEEGSAGLPVSVQVAARPWREHGALAAMQLIEAASIAQGEHPGRPAL